MAQAQANAVSEEEIPENFEEKIARDVMVIFQKQMDLEAAAAEASAYIWQNTGTPEKVSSFVDATELLLESHAVADKFAALSWNGLANQSAGNDDYDSFLRMMIDSILDGYYTLLKPDIEYKSRKYSTYTSILGNTFIRMVEHNASYAENASTIFSILVRHEMDLEAKSKAEEEETGHSSFPSEMHKLFDELIEYLTNRAEYKATPLTGDEDNPNEHIEILAERLRSARRYVMQEVINERALEKRKQLELELENQLASAEEIVMAAPHFTEGMAFFAQEKRFNLKYLAVEKIRVTLQLLGSITGAVYFLLGFMGVWGISWIDGLVVCAVMLIFVRIAGSRKQLRFFYPTDISKELEECSTAFISVMRNMSQEQLEHFLVRQIKLDENQKYLSMVPEFVKYLYAVMPDRKSMMISLDELTEVVENSEIEVAKQMRGQ
jgi:hypothetical protein